MKLLDELAPLEFKIIVLAVVVHQENSIVSKIIDIDNLLVEIQK